MFSELTQEDIIDSINSNYHRPFREGIDYSVFYNGRKYSAREIINRHYISKGLTHPNPSFNTNNAQEALLKLGFPIVENNSTNPSDFFTQKDMLSFHMIVARRKYVSSNPVDRNIAHYLNQISWGKTKFWAGQLHDKRWNIEGRKQWNSMDRVLKQVYKEYTWFRLIPKETDNNKVFFTVGIDWFANKQLIFKMDIQREDPYFNKERREYFDARIIELGIERVKVKFEDLPNYNWDRLVSETKKFIEDNLENYNLIIKELETIRPIMAARICWNSFGWTEPSGRRGKSTSHSFESRTGFANDEWLFDLDSTLEGYCYSRIEPINKSRNKLIGRNIDLMLFTYNNESNIMRWAGKIKNVSIVGPEESQLIFESPEGQNWQKTRLEQLKAIDGLLHSEYQNMDRRDFYNIKFKPHDVEVFDDNLLVAEGLFKLKRYILNEFNRAGERLARTSASLDNFEPSELVPPLTPPNKKKRTFTAGTKEYDDTHKDIQNGLLRYLSKNYPNAKITSENSQEINNRLIDVVMKLGNRKIYFEIKSYPSLRTSIRVALGQLIEYCFYCDSNRATELIIVSQIETNENIEKFMLHLRNTIGLNVYYCHFDLEECKLNNWE